MKAGRAAIAAVLLLVAVAIEAAYAAPISSIATLRAAVCCAAHCSHTRRSAADCCQINQQALEPANFSKPKVTFVVATFVVAMPMRAFDTFRPVHGAFAASREVFARPAPIFLVDRSLRL